MTASNNDDSQRIVKIVLEDQPRIRLSPQIEHERKSALFDLIEDNHFAPIGAFHGPYILHLAMKGGGLVFDLHDKDDQPLTHFSFSLGRLRRIIKEYFVVCDSYFKSIKTATPSRIEAIDMGRRGLHNEGAELLRARLAERVEIDPDTARRLFTLICVLQIRA